VQNDPQLVIHVTDEMIRHSRILDILYFTGFVYGVVELLIILNLRISARLRDLAARATNRPYLIAMTYVVLFAIVTAVLNFPLVYYSGYVVPHQFNLTDQKFGAWLGDEAKALLIGTMISIILVPLALLAIRGFKRWWVVLSIGSIPVIILLFVIAPVFIDPVFNKFEPLKDQVLKQKLLDEAARAGIEGSRVYEVDKSKQTKTMNAYVTGLGPTKRIVMWDTLLAKLDQDEILAVMGHEMGHYVLHHVWQAWRGPLWVRSSSCSSPNASMNRDWRDGERVGESARPVIRHRCRGCWSLCLRSHSSDRRSRTAFRDIMNISRTCSAWS